ncbi:Serine/threonine-protein kinase PknB [Anatilimnocola aggregata]|uniref:non-specific serine/threonine protein kinase n=2 Tax=Anatilimnocola aggregata TaxID=2528021 RepID=A0A517YHJ7_9BACT|nr:Serine/threonine-protein kinase PknB [Anatilimnocola aggregata]
MEDATIDSSFLRRLEKRWPTSKLETKLGPAQPLLQRLGRFEIRRELGRGRFGVVFLAWDPQLHRHVALKIPQFDAALDPDLRERFRGEAKAAGCLDHPGIVSIHDVGQNSGIDYIAMAYIDGMTLAERLKAGPLPPLDAARLTIGLAAAVQHAHEQGVIHRDLKPSNILIDKSDQPHVMDFGLARQLSESAMRATATGQVLGTPAYMSPEQATGKSDVGPLSDVYALGVILYEVITGRPPFQAGTFAEAIEFIVNRDPLPPSKLIPKLPRELDAITFKCLEKSSSARYESAADLADDLQRFLDGRPIRARAQGYVQQSIRWCRKYPSRALLLVTVFIALGLLLTTGSIYSRWQYADKLAKEQQQNAATERYYATVTRARNLIARRTPDWTKVAEDQLRAAIANQTPVADPLELRALATEFLAGFDLNEVANINAEMLVERIAFSPDGQLLAVGELKGTATCRVVLIDTTSLTPKHTFTIVNVGSSVTRLLEGASRWQEGVREFAFSGDSRYLAVGMRFGSIYCYDLHNPQQPPKHLPIGDSRELSRIRMSADGRALYAITKKDDSLLHWPDWRNDSKARSTIPDKSLSMAVAASGEAVFVQRLSSNELRMFDSRLRPRTWYPPLCSMLKGIERDLATNDDGSLLAGASDYGLCVYETAGGVIARHIQADTVGDEPVASELFISADGQLLAGYSDRGFVRLFDISNGRQLIRLTLDKHDCQDVALDPQKRWLVVANDRQLSFRKIRESRVCRAITNAAQSVNDMNFSPDGKSLACAWYSGGIHGTYLNSLTTFDCETSQPLATFSGGFDSAGFSLDWPLVAWRPNGQELVWKSNFGTVVCGTVGLHSTERFFPLPLQGPVVPIEFEITELNGARRGATKQAPLIALEENDSHRVWTVQPNSQELRFTGALKSALRPNKQAGTLLFLMKLDAAYADEPPFTFSRIGAREPVNVYLPTRNLKGQSADYQWFSVDLQANDLPLKELNLKLTPTSNLRSFAIASIHYVALNLESHPTSGKISAEPFNQLTFNTTGDRLWGTINDEVRCWSYPECKLLTRWTNPSHFLTGAGNQRSLAAGTNGTLAGTRDGRVHWLNPQTGTSDASWPGPGRETVVVALCEPAQLALAAAENGKVRGIRVPTGAILFDLPAHQDAITAMAATPDGATLVTASADRELKIWHRGGDGFKLFTQLPDTSSPTSVLRISSDGRYLAVLGRATACVELWDLKHLQTELESMGIP